MNLNKKVIYLTIFLVLALFLISYYQQHKGISFKTVEEISFKTVAEECEENWQCSEWGNCVNEQQTRNCEDMNNCNPANVGNVEINACILSRYYFSMKVGEEIRFNISKPESVIVLLDVSPSGNVVVSVDGTQVVIAAGNKTVINRLSISNFATFYSEKDRYAILKIAIDSGTGEKPINITLGLIEFPQKLVKTGDTYKIKIKETGNFNEKNIEMPILTKILIVYSPRFIDIDQNIKDPFATSIEEKIVYCSEIDKNTCIIEFDYTFLKEGIFYFIIWNYKDKTMKDLIYSYFGDISYSLNNLDLETNDFPIGLFASWRNKYIPLNDFKKIKELGVDTIISNYPLYHNADILFLSQKYGLRAILIDFVNSYYYYIPNLKLSSLNAQIKNIVNANEKFYVFKSFYRYYPLDEPRTIEEIEKVKLLIDELNERNSPVSGTTTLIPDLNLIKYYYKNVGSKEVMVDHYPLEGTSKRADILQFQLDRLTNKLNDLNELSKRYNKPFWFVIQAHYWKDKITGGELRDPDPKEIREMVNLALAYGAKGIFYYYYWSDDNNEYTSRGLVVDMPEKIVDPYEPNAKYYEVQKINNQLKKIRNILIDLENIKTCNSRDIGNKKESLINNKWEFEQIGWDYNYGVLEKGGIDLLFKGENLDNIMYKDDRWFDFWYQTDINTNEKQYNLLIDYEILSNPKDLTLYFNPKRNYKYVKNILMPSYEGKHEFKINLNSIEGTYNINRMEFFIDNLNQGEMEFKINDIREYNCELPYISEITENIEVGNFMHKNGDKYIFFVNRDTVNNIQTNFKLNMNGYLYDVLEDKEIHPGNNEIFSYSLKAGDGRLLKIIES